MSAAEWYYAVKNQRHGPVTLEQLQIKATGQELGPTDLVWKPGFAAWTQAQKVPGIFLDRTVAGAISPEEAPRPVYNLEKTEVTTPTPAAVPAKAAPETLVPQAAATARPSEEEKLYLTELPGASPVEDIDSLTGEALPASVRPARRAPVPTDTSLGGFALRWNLRDVAVSDAEQSQFLASGVEEPRLQQYLAWRRSLLQLLIIPAALCVVFGLAAVTQQEGLTGLGRLVGFLHIVPLLTMPVVILWALTVWWQWKQSRTMLLYGWLISLVMPLLLGLCPPGWQVLPVPPNALVIWGLTLVVYILPTVWTFLPGTLRAALRLKELMPEDSFSGWVAAGTALLHALFTAAFLLTLNAFTGNLFLLAAGLCFTLAPLAYLWTAATLLRPLTTEEEKTAVAFAQLAHLALTVAGLVLLMIFAFSADIAGKRLVGGDADTSWIRPWNGRLWLFPLELFTRSLLTTLVTADLLMLLTLRFWRQTRDQQGTPTAQTQELFLAKVEQEIIR